MQVQEEPIAESGLSPKITSINNPNPYKGATNGITAMDGNWMMPPLVKGYCLLNGHQTMWQ